MQNIDKANAVMRVAWELDQLGVDAWSLEWGKDCPAPRVVAHVDYVEDVDAVAKAHGLTCDEYPESLYAVGGTVAGERVRVYSGADRHRPAEPATKPRLRVAPIPPAARLGDWSAVADAAWAQGVAP